MTFLFYYILSHVLVTVVSIKQFKAIIWSVKASTILWNIYHLQLMYNVTSVQQAHQIRAANGIINRLDLLWQQ
jgi:hypothetical protein